MKLISKIIPGILAILLIYSCDEKPAAPVLTTAAITDITTTTAVSGGQITDDGGAAVIAKGVCWNTSGNPTIEDNKSVESSASNTFSSSLSQLVPGVIYYVRAYATNSAGTGYGEQVSFKTQGDKPAALTKSVSNITINSATLTGSVNSNQLPTTVTFEWGTSVSYGNTITAPGSPASGSSSSDFSVEMTGLTPGTTYHFRITATNELGTSAGNDLTFKTLGGVPSVQPVPASNLQYSSATINGSVNPNHFSTTVSIEWGATMSYGNMINASPGSLSGSDFTTVSADLSGLIQGTTYHFRIIAVNELGTTTSPDMIFKTLEPVTDIDGNVYNIRTIGTQVWMTENLKTTRYNNGDPIGTTSTLTKDISTESMPKYQWAYEGNEANAAIYGRLYTSYAVTDPRKVCPSGWHIPSDEEWTTLTNFLIDNGYGYEGNGDDIAKSMAAKSLWAYNSTPGNVGNDLVSNNSSGFSALPAGYRPNNDNVAGGFYTLNWVCAWWSSTDLTDKLAWQRIMQNQNNNVVRSYLGQKHAGISVRCIKDQGK